MKRLTKIQEEKIVTEIVFSHLDNVEGEKPAPLKAYFERNPIDFVYSAANDFSPKTKWKTFESVTNVLKTLRYKELNPFFAI